MGNLPVRLAVTGSAMIAFGVVLIGRFNDAWTFYLGTISLAVGLACYQTGTRT